MEAIMILVLIGALGGLIRAILGYNVQSDAGEKFNWFKLVRSMIRAAVAGSLLVYNTIDITPEGIGTKIYIGAFFTSMGADVFLKEIYGTLTTKKETLQPLGGQGN